MKRKADQRVGMQAASLFESTTRAPQKTVEPAKPQIVHQAQTEERVSRGRPKELAANAVKSTVTFNNSQIVWLDRLSADIRASTMAIVDRGSIIRAIVSAVEKSGIDLSNASSEQQIHELICQKLG